MKKDAALFSIIRKELHRQTSGLELIASENFVSDQVLKAMGPALRTNMLKDIPEKDIMAAASMSTSRNSLPSTAPKHFLMRNGPMFNLTPEPRRTWRY